MTEPLRLRAPGSKSETQRALVLCALAEGESTISGALDCDDSRALRVALRALGAGIARRDEVWLVRGGELHAPALTIDCGEAGTTLRFLLPLALLLDGELVLDGAPRLRERPIEELLLSLRSLGVRVRHLGAPLRLPLALRRERPAGASVAIDASRSSQYASVAIDASRSSQYASGLLLTAPRLPQGLELRLSGDLVSRPYLELTVRMMREMGTTVEQTAAGLRVAGGGYRPGALQVRGDWSSGAFLLAAAFISGRTILLENLDEGSAQADRAVRELIARLRLPGPHRLDLRDCPDLLPPLAAAAAFAQGPVELVGIAHARLKESDRPAVLASRLSRAGVQVSEGADWLRVEPGGRLRAVRLDPAGDHRMAMAFGLLSLREPGITVENPGCVSKSYPGFWADLERFR